MDGRTAQLDQQCVQRMVGSRLLAKATGMALGLTGVPGVGKVGGYAVGYATNPNCSPTVTTEPPPGPRGRRAQAAQSAPQPQPAFRIEPAAPPGR